MRKMLPLLILGLSLPAAAARTAQTAVVRLEPDGSLTLFTSQMPHGQSHETTMAQIAAACSVAASTELRISRPVAVSRATYVNEGIILLVQNGFGIA